MFKHIVVASGPQPAAVNEAARKLQVLDGRATTKLENFHLDPVRPEEMLDELLKQAVESQADLLVMGARRHVMASRVAMLAPCSVLMVPDNSTLAFARILIPVDFSESSADAVRLGFTLAEIAGADRKVVAVESDDSPWLDMDWVNNPEQLLHKLTDFVEEATALRVPEACLVEPLNRSTKTLEGDSISPAHGIEGADIASTIVDVARREQASLIVMGTRGRSRSASILLGSVTEKVIQWSPMPVLAVKRSGGGQLGLIEGLAERMRKERPSLTVS